MADGNKMKCFSTDPNCACGCPKDTAQEMRTFRKKRTRPGKPGASVAKTKENAVEAAIEQSADSSSEP
jgi:hypothetical protein